MTLLFVEGFGSYQTGSHNSATQGDDMYAHWNDFGTPELFTYQTGSQGIINYFTDNAETKAYSPLSLDLATGDTMSIGVLFWNNTTDPTPIIEFQDTNKACITGLGKNSSNELVLATTRSFNAIWSSMNVQTITSSATIAVGAWSYLEAEIALGAAGTGSVSFYSNNIPVGTWTGIATRTAATTITRIGIAPESYLTTGWDDTQHRITNIYVRKNQPRLGPIKVWYQPADLTGSYSEFTPSSGSNNANMVKEIESDEDSTYNESDISGSKDSFRTSYQITESPIAIQNLIWAKSISGSSNLVAGTISDPAGGAYYGSGSTVGLNTGSYQAVNSNILETDPSASAAWTVSRVNTAEIYYQRG